jgi:hypothetical protein
MKKVMLVTLAVLALAAAAFASDESTAKPWFDLEKCGFCKAFAAQPGLLDNMKHHSYDVNNGVLMVNQIPKEFQPAFKIAQADMQKVVADLQAGKDIYKCEHCTQIGEFYKMNVRAEEIHADFGDIVLMTSSDPAVVTKLQAFGARNNQEIAKFEAKVDQPSKKY